MQPPRADERAADPWLVEEFARVVSALESVLGQRSGWRDWPALVVRDGWWRHRGQTVPGRHVAVNEAILDEPTGRWLTLLHEALHTFEPTLGGQRSTAQRAQGEWIVEQCARACRARVAGAVGQNLSPDVCLARDAVWEGWPFSRDMESARARNGAMVLDYYLALLLAASLAERGRLMRLDND